MPLLLHLSLLANSVWVTADVFVGPGVAIGDGAVITARSSVFSDIEPWVVARVIRPEPVKHAII